MLAIDFREINVAFDYAAKASLIRVNMPVIVSVTRVRCNAA